MSKKIGFPKKNSKFIDIGVLILYPNYYPKPEVRNPKPEMKLYEKPDPTRYPNTQTRPDPKPGKVLPVAALVSNCVFCFSVCADILKGPYGALKQS